MVGTVAVGGTGWVQTARDVAFAAAYVVGAVAVEAVRKTLGARSAALVAGNVRNAVGAAAVVAAVAAVAATVGETDSAFVVAAESGRTSVGGIKTVAEEVDGGRDG